MEEDGGCLLYTSFLNARRIRLLKYMAASSIKGRMAKMITVKSTLLLHRIRKETKIFKKAMKNSSGQWCANSVTSNRSLVILAISCPILVS